MENTATKTLINVRNRTDSVYFIFKYLWVFIIVPKEIQFALLACLLIVLLYKSKWTVRVPKFIFAFIAYAVIHLFSVFINSIINEHSFSRILAALNTDFIWFVAVGYFAVIYGAEKSLDLFRVGKYCFINIVILFVIYVISKVLSLTSVNLIFETRSFWTADWIDGVEGIRFTGLFEYSVLVGLFNLLLVPYALLYLFSINRKFLYFITLLVSFWLSYECGSRSVQVLMLCEIVIAIYYFIKNLNISNSAKRYIIVVSCLIVLIVVACSYQLLLDKFVDLLYSREGSTNTRFNIYITSLTQTLQHSPIIGLGIKDMMGSVPLGSHSTYVGVFYKTGILGSMFFCIALIGLIVAYLRKKKTLNFICFIGYILCFLAALLFEDLDGANWLIVVYFSLQALVLRRGGLYGGEKFRHDRYRYQYYSSHL